MLELTTAEVTAVSTFYTMYRRKPTGDYQVGRLHQHAVRGDGRRRDLRRRSSEHLGVGNDETTEDGKVTLEHIECNAACDFAPVVMVNWEFFDNQTPESAKQLVDDLRAGRDRSSRPAAPRCARTRRPPASWPASPTSAPARSRRPAARATPR